MVGNDISCDFFSEGWCPREWDPKLMLWDAFYDFVRFPNGFVWLCNKTLRIPSYPLPSKKTSGNLPIIYR